MPLPKPRSKEEKDKFISRCMGDKTMKKEYPDSKQRTAVCYSQWDKKTEESNEVKVSLNSAEYDEEKGKWVIRDVLITKNSVMNRKYKSWDEIKTAFDYAKGIPVTQYHPPSLLLDPDDSVGFTFNERLDKKAKGIRVDIAVNEDTHEKIKNKTFKDVSITFLRNLQEKPGSFQDSQANEEYKYDFIEKNIIVNHLALLPEGTGACSQSQGCGINKDDNVTNEEKNEENDEDKFDINEVLESECFAKKVSEIVSETIAANEKAEGQEQNEEEDAVEKLSKNIEGLKEDIEKIKNQHGKIQKNEEEKLQNKVNEKFPEMDIEGLSQNQLEAILKVPGKANSIEGNQEEKTDFNTNQPLNWDVEKEEWNEE